MKLLRTILPAILKQHRVSNDSTDFLKVYDQLLNCLNIRKIEVTGTKKTKVEYNYYLDDDNWKQLQIKELKKGYESHSLRQVGKQVH